MDEHGYCLVFGEGMCRVFDSPSMDYLIIKLLMKTSFTQSTWIWHKRLGHLHFGGLKHLRDKEMVHGLPTLEEQSGVKGVNLENNTRMFFQKNKLKEQAKHSNDFTRMIWVYFLRNKSEAFSCFKKFKSMTELQTGHQICEAHGIQRQLTMAYTPQQNGVVERKNRTVIEMAKSMLHDKGMPYFLWAETVHTAVYLLNRCPTKALHNITPFESYSGRKPGIAHLKVFGSLCYVHVPAELRHKLDPKSTKGVFVGYATCEKGYRVFDPVSNKLILSRDVTFDEEGAWHWTDNNDSVMTPYTIENQGRTSSTPSDISSEEKRTQAYDHTPLKWRKLDDVLAQCNLCIMEPKKYADAAQDESWLKAKRMEHGNWWIDQLKNQ
ncbi:unnamed protein product [Prunus armeniaca]